MKLQYLGSIGGPGGLTGSCTWVNYSRTNTQFLVDCGSFQGPQSDHLNLEEFPFDPRDIRFVLLTHAHSDHCGRIPLLYKRGFRGSVICTKATKELAKLQFEDALQHGYAAQAGIEKEDIEKIRFRCLDEHPKFKFGDLTTSISEDLWACFSRSSHMLGAVAITVSWLDQHEQLKTICFSGDIGSQSDRGDIYQFLAKGNHYPHPDADFLVVESTYGKDSGKEAPDDSKVFDARIACLREYIEQSRGDIVIPCFALHRTQAVLADLYYLFHEDKLQYPCEVVLDSLLGRRATAVYGDELLRKKSNGKYTYFPDDFARGKLGLSTSADVDDFIKTTFPQMDSEEGKVELNGHSIIYRPLRADERESNGNTRRIIVSSSGMCSAGAVVKHLKAMLPDEDCTVILTGYQANGTVGSQLRRRVPGNEHGIDENEELRFSDSNNNGKHKKPEKKLTLGEVNANILDMGRFYSGHADRGELLQFVFDPEYWNQRKKNFTVFLNHGDYKARRDLKKAIEAKHSELGGNLLKEVQIPKSSQEWFDLNHDGKKVPSNEEVMFDVLEKLSSIEKVLKTITGKNDKKRT